MIEFEYENDIPTPNELRALAKFFDCYDMNNGNANSEIQSDCRRWAINIERAVSKSKQMNEL